MTDKGNTECMSRLEDELHMSSSDSKGDDHQPVIGIEGIAEFHVMINKKQKRRRRDAT